MLEYDLSVILKGESNGIAVLVLMCPHDCAKV